MGFEEGLGFGSVAAEGGDCLGLELGAEAGFFEGFLQLGEGAADLVGELGGAAEVEGMLAAVLAIGEAVVGA